MTPFPEDEFDKAAKSREPKGVHRPAEPPWKKFLPLVAALILGPLLAWGFIQALNRDSAGEAPPAATETAVSDTAVPGEEIGAGAPAEAEGAEGEEGQAEEALPEPQVAFDASVVVLNGSRVTGIAGRTAERIAELGFTNTEAADYNQAQPVVSTIFYNNAELADAVALIGDSLGIAERVELASATDSIAIVIRGDFQE
ncbi:MAG TPA: LytR C-terminal domain-containing protein [Actinomycetaceae bacterium]|nr:LytR C-terminal domain-containing protein [Actinomycetaceae bacterium]